MSAGALHGGGHLVDDLWGDAVGLGVPLIAASFPRDYIDANRAVDEIDPLLAQP